MTKNQTIFVIVLMMVLISAPLLAASSSIAVQAVDTPVLVNGDFEGDFTPRGAGEVVVAEGWDPAWIQGDDRECREPCFRPEYQPELQGDICLTGKCQRWFTTFSRQFAAIYQRVSIEQGKWYEFSCDVYNISEPDGRMEVFVGINPWGGDPFHRTMIWGKGYVYPYRTWTRVEVIAQAWGDTITVAAGANNNFATHNNASYWDNCSIRLVDDPGPQPTQTPLPTYTPYPTPAPCPTCTPGGGCGCEDVRAVIREELDKTTWGSVD